MTSIDLRFDREAMEQIRAMVGKRMKSFKTPPFFFVSNFYGIVGIELSDKSFAFINQTELLDYYGRIDEVAVFRMEKRPYSEIHSFALNEKMVVTPIDQKIRKIVVVNECQKLFENEIQMYENYVTRGIVFHFADGLELAFEKNVWFSEDISVWKGYDVIKNFTPTQEFVDVWEGGLRGECTREMVEFNL